MMKKNQDTTDILDFDKKFGFTQISNTLIMNMRKLNLTGNELSFLSIIKMFAFQGESSFPSISKIREISGISRRTIIYIIKSLEDKGYLIIKRTKAKRNMYSFKPLNELLEKIIKGVNIEEATKKVVQNLHHPDSAKNAPKVVQNLHPNNKHNKNNIKTHTTAVCDEGIQKTTTKISELKLFEKIVPKVIVALARTYDPEEIRKAAVYLAHEYEGRELEVRRPVGLLKQILKDGMYSDISPEEAPGKNSLSLSGEIQALNDEFNGSRFKNIKIAELLNIGGKIAIIPADITCPMVLTAAKNKEEFAKFINTS